MCEDVRMSDASMTYTKVGNYDFVTTEFLFRGRPRYGGRFIVGSHKIQSFTLFLHGELL